MRPLRVRCSFPLAGARLTLSLLTAWIAAAPAARAADLLLVPDAANQRVMAFDAETGDVQDLDYVDDSAGALIAPIAAIGFGSGIAVADQDADLVFRYDRHGNPLANPPAFGSLDPGVLDNVRGIAMRSGKLLVAVGGSSSVHQDAVVEFAADGSFVQQAVAPGAALLDSPFGLLVDETGGRLLVTGSSSAALHAYDLTTGPPFAPLSDLAAIDSFPEQIALSNNGNLLVANFEGLQRGIVEYQPSGSFVRRLVPNSEGFRGVAELGDGALLVTSTTGVHKVNRTSGSIIATYDLDPTSSLPNTPSPRFIGFLADPLAAGLLDFRIE